MKNKRNSPFRSFLEEQAKLKDLDYDAFLKYLEEKKAFHYNQNYAFKERLKNEDRVKVLDILKMLEVLDCELCIVDLDTGANYKLNAELPKT